MVASIPDASKDVRQDISGVSQLLGNTMPEESLDPYNNAAKIVYLCSENAGGISGQVIETQGWDMSLYSSRIPSRHIYTEKQSSLKEIEQLVPRALTKPEQDLTVNM